MTYGPERIGCSRSDQWEVSVTPIKLSDAELDCVMAAARPLAVEMRDPFLRAVALELQGCREIGPGVVHQVGREQQRIFMNGAWPEFTRETGVASKYR
jgi:hypothetical protein